MTNHELNQYIAHYIKEDKTHSAILLTAGWGAGKSFYIKNELVPFLEQEENGKIQCIVVSLYGLTCLSEVSKALFFESRIKRPLSGSASTISITAKTVLKGALGYLGVSLDMSNDDLQKLYDSVNLSGKLIILEDIERSQIDIIQVLGYVNSLVEQDGVKVLLVANEDEIVQFIPSTGNSSPRPISRCSPWDTNAEAIQYTESSIAYLAAKEKTISDTIVFSGDVHHAIKTIVKQFDNSLLSGLMTDENIFEIQFLLTERQTFNLRSFTYACQKTVDIYQAIDLDSNRDSDFAKTILYGILIFTFRLKTGECQKWKGNLPYSVELGNKNYPLFRFCYDYITEQHFNNTLVESARDGLKYLRLYASGSATSDKDLLALYSYSIQSEENVRTAIENISGNLKDLEFYPFTEYGRIALYLVTVSHIIDCDILEAKELLIHNLHGKYLDVRAEYLFAGAPDEDLESNEVKDEFSELCAKMLASLNASGESIFDFDYEPNSISSFSDSVAEHTNTILKDASFAARLDMDRVIEMLKKCSSVQIMEFRAIFCNLYQPGNIQDFLSGDRKKIEELHLRVNELSNFSGYDKIQKKQINWFATNLSDILRRL